MVTHLQASRFHLDFASATHQRLPCTFHPKILIAHVVPVSAAKYRSRSDMPYMTKKLAGKI
jgi:hypothetical protein